MKGLQGLSILLGLFCKTDHFCERTTSLRKHPFLLALRRNVPSGEERGETDVFAG